MPPLVNTGPVIGHRGAAGLAPENTLAGLVRARASGCAWVEVDAKLTADGVAVLFHDDTLDRTTDGTGAFSGATWSALRSLDAGGWFSSQNTGEGVPTLVDALEFAADFGLGVNVEIKPSPGRAEETARAVLDALASSGRGLSVLLSSFDGDALALARDAWPDVPRALIVSVLDGDEVACAQALDCEGLHIPDKGLTAETVRALKAEGLSVRVYTVNGPARARDLWSWGVDAVFTDFPDRVKP